MLKSFLSNFPSLPHPRKTPLRSFSLPPCSPLSLFASSFPSPYASTSFTLSFTPQSGFYPSKEMLCLRSPITSSGLFCPYLLDSVYFDTIVYPWNTPLVFDDSVSFSSPPASLVVPTADLFPLISIIICYLSLRFPSWLSFLLLYSLKTTLEFPAVIDLSCSIMT